MPLNQDELRQVREEARQGVKEFLESQGMDLAQHQRDHDNLRRMWTGFRWIGYILLLTGVGYFFTKVDQIALAGTYCNPFMGGRMPGWIIVSIVALVVAAVVAALLLFDDGVSQEFQSKINDALDWWSKTDDKLYNMGTAYLKSLHSDVRYLLNYSGYLAEETREKLEDLDNRLFRLIG
jgi:hypothetical protein